MSRASKMSRCSGGPQTTVCRYQNSPGLHQPVAVCARSARCDPALRGVGGGCRGCAARCAAGARLTRRRDHRNCQSSNPRFHQRRIRSDPGRHSNAIESEVAAWFDGAMDRVSGEFKRWTQAATFAIALASAVFFNINSIRVGEALWEHPAIADQLYAAEQAQPPKSDTVSQSAPAQSSDFLADEKKALADIQALLSHLFEVSDTHGDPTYVWFSQTFGQSLVGWLMAALATQSEPHSGSTLCSRSFASKERAPVRTTRRRSERPRAGGFARRN